MEPCSIDDCENVTAGRGWCSKHYYRWRRHGDPLVVSRRGSTHEEREMSPEDLFWRRVNRTDACWLWTLKLMPNGYGRFHVKGTDTSIYAHRMAYELVKGPIPAGCEIHHKCENKACVNPDHLEALTVAAHRALGWGRTHCPHDHEYTETNIYINPKGVKICRKCQRLSNRKRALKH